MIRILTDGDGVWGDLANSALGKRVIHLGENSVIEVARLRGGMQSGKSSVMLRLDLPDGAVVLAETSMALFQTTAAALRGAEERDGLA